MYRETSPFLDWSRDGTLLYVPTDGIPRSDFAFAWYREDGSEHLLGLKVFGELPWPSLSPDGRRLAVTVGRYAIWVYDLENARPPLRLTFSRDLRWPIWSPDGSRVAFRELLAGSVHFFSIAADGSEVEPRAIASVLLPEREGAIFPSSWTPDGAEILAFDSRSIWVFEVDGSSRPRRLFDSPFVEGFPSISPDGQLLAYTSNRSGAGEIWLSRYPDVDSAPPVQVSRNGGAEPRWSRDGQKLYFLEGQRMMSAIISLDGARVEAPRALFTLTTEPRAVNRTYDVAPDGRILAIRRETPTERSRAILVENWFDDLERLAPR